MKGIYSEHKKLCIFAALVSLLFVIYGCLLVSHYIEKDRVAHKPGTTLEMLPDVIEYKEYNVDGMSEEEINKYIEMIRNGENDTDE